MIQLIFRKQNRQSFSIEKVFASIKPQLAAGLPVQEQYAYTRSASPLAIARNLFHLQKIKGNLYHITGDIHYAVFAFPRKRTLLTIHDCVFLYTSSGWRRWIFKKLWLQWPVRYARYITTISEKSKQEIIEFTGCNPDKITIIPDPVAQHIYYREKEFNTRQPVLLFIGTKSNKNLPRAIEAIKNISCTLDIVGALTTEQQQLLQQAAIHYTNHIGLTDEQLAERYAACDALLYPSTYEGFGLPVLEAQKAGRPIIASNISPMKDVAGAGACLVDPFNIASIREGLLKVLENEQYRQNLVQEGFKNVALYSPDKIADQYRQVYQTILAAIH